MTKPLLGREIAKQISEHFPQAIVESDEVRVIVIPESLFRVAQFLKTTPGLEFDYLTSITAVDCLDYFEVVYHLTSIEHNHSLVLKTRCYSRESPGVPSVTSLWRGADFQEREVFDLMGITFSGHPNLKRLFLWEGFQGYPLRRDYL
ncbi:MAG TPA: NADH-quinone oxidoreductase subunit C [Dehalococcoidia bacterium]|nr:NADH-quinone oxidoreductase subunit C [Dehalococcoidia bacterium]